jgi:1-deoxy-D-xylulose-5-phosphate synthase
MHYVFDTPSDQLVWDVGHQAYAHKILTGRRDELHTIKQYGGLSGFLRRDESEYDTFGAGHASTSISAALGMAIARDTKREDFNVCALIGDSSLAGGMAMEAINQAGHLKSRLIVLLNDNGMSIAPAVGSLSGYLNRIKEAQSYQHLKEEIGDALESVPGIGGSLRRAAKSFKDAIAAAVLPGALVNELGFKYIGYVDGHNVADLVRALEAAKKVDDGPVIVHALTTKGKGFPNPEKNYYAYHATGPFDPKTGLPYKSSKVTPPTYTQIFGDTMCELMGTIAMDRAGVVGADGPTHHGLLDIAYLRGYPNIVLMAPKDEAEMRDMLLTAIEHPGAAAIRYPRGNGFGVDISSPPKEIEIGKAEILSGDISGGDVAIIAYGSMVYPAVEAAAKLAKNGVDATVINARFVKPLDDELITELARCTRLIVTVEDAYLAGGFGSAVLELLEENTLSDKIKVVRMGVPDLIVPHGDPKLLMAKYGLDADGIYAKVSETLDIMDDNRLNKNRIKAVG